jgi:hypothetical protein
VDGPATPYASGTACGRLQEWSFSHIEAQSTTSGYYLGRSAALYLIYFTIHFILGHMTGDVYRRLAEALLDAFRELAAQQATPEAASEDGASPGPVPRPAEEHNLGKRQRQIVELPNLATQTGARTAEIAEAIDYTAPNTYTALQALARSQVVEQVPGSPSQRWRLVQRYRTANTEFAWVADQLGPEEWTTAGISRSRYAAT